MRTQIGYIDILGGSEKLEKGGVVVERKEGRDYQRLDGFAMVPHHRRGHAHLAPATTPVLHQAAPQLCRARTAPTASNEAQGGTRPGVQDGDKFLVQRVALKQRKVYGVGREHGTHAVDAIRAAPRHVRDVLRRQASMRSPS